MWVNLRHQPLHGGTARVDCRIEGREGRTTTDIGKGVRRPSLALLIAVVCSCSFLGPSSAGAASSAESFVTMFSEGDYIGLGADRFYHPDNAQIGISGDGGYVTVSVNGKLGDWFGLEFAAPPGEVLAPGDYEHAQRAPFRKAGSPG